MICVTVAQKKGLFFLKHIGLPQYVEILIYLLTLTSQYIIVNVYSILIYLYTHFYNLCDINSRLTKT